MPSLYVKWAPHSGQVGLEGQGPLAVITAGEACPLLGLSFPICIMEARACLTWSPHSGDDCPRCQVSCQQKEPRPQLSGTLDLFLMQ